MTANPRPADEGRTCEWVSRRVQVLTPSTPPARARAYIHLTPF